MGIRANQHLRDDGFMIRLSLTSPVPPTRTSVNWRNHDVNTSESVAKQLSQESDWFHFTDIGTCTNCGISDRDFCSFFRQYDGGQQIANYHAYDTRDLGCT